MDFSSSGFLGLDFGGVSAYLMLFSEFSFWSNAEVTVLISYLCPLMSTSFLDHVHKTFEVGPEMVWVGVQIAVCIRLLSVDDVT